MLVFLSFFSDHEHSLQRAVIAGFAVMKEYLLQIGYCDMLRMINAP